MEDKLLFDTILFDLDGTLTDSADGIKHALRYALEKMGQPADPNDSLDFYIGPPLHDSLIRNYPDRDEAWIKETVRIYRAFYDHCALTENSVYVGVPRMLRHLRALGARLIVATSKPQRSAEQVLEHFGLKQYFDFVCGATLDNTRTFKKDVITHALRFGGVRGSVVMVGDREHDVEGARANGIPSIGVRYGYGKPEEFKPCLHVAQTVDELETYLCGSVQRGRFIVFEGMDGAGKSTHAKRLCERLRHEGFPVVHTREPGGSGCPIAEAIRSLVLDVRHSDMMPLTEAYLYAAARAQHVEQVILPALDRGEIVVCDRFAASSVAYQGYGRDLGGAFIEDLNRAAIGKAIPDMTLFFYIDAETAFARNRASGKVQDRLEQQPEDFRARVQHGFEVLCAEKDYVRIDASGKKEDVAQQVYEAVSACI